eukprot:NODE_14761_length_438_cov_86.263492_g14462_i0.p1 GENE.NODE_14761_length_438_cov_86.263492_g14462_i0~~NODE_14761_length_438_cov_86.263492_g14462_i0.p1  ORF type:complete len:122 (+),score=0.98 NODE_14761_length_438_cov_86.263492_g14462_i0:68-433(+)
MYDNRAFRHYTISVPCQLIIIIVPLRASFVPHACVTHKENSACNRISAECMGLQVNALDVFVSYQIDGCHQAVLEFDIYGLQVDLHTGHWPKCSPLYLPPDLLVVYCSKKKKKKKKKRTLR